MFCFQSFKLLVILLNFPTDFIFFSKEAKWKQIALNPPKCLKEISLFVCWQNLWKLWWSFVYSPFVIFPFKKFTQEWPTEAIKVTVGVLRGKQVQHCGLTYLASDMKQQVSSGVLGWHLMLQHLVDVKTFFEQILENEFKKFFHKKIFSFTFVIC